MIHESVASPASSDVRMVGSATLTMVVSSRAMNMPMSRTMRDCHARRDTVGADASDVDGDAGELVDTLGNLSHREQLA